MKGTHGQEMFNSTISAGCSKQFWFSCTASTFPVEGQVLLWVGGSSRSCPSPFVSLSSCISPFSFSGWSGSALSLYDVWVVRSLVASLLTAPALRLQRSSSDSGIWEIIVGSAALLTSARFPTVGDRLEGTWVWRGHLRLQGLPGH